MPKLTKRFVDTVKKPGLHGDGEGLYLSVKPSGAKSYVLRTVVHGKRRDFGLGSVADTSLADAREKAREMRKVARDGGDPGYQKKEKSLTFGEAAQAYYQIIAPSFSSGKHAALWLSGLKKHVFPRLGTVPVAVVTVTDVRQVLEPIWTSKYETARRMKQRMEAVFDWAIAEGHRETSNPVSGVKRVLKPQTRSPRHHPALPWQELPEFYARLNAVDTMAAKTLQFLILTACRSREVREIQWSEVVGGVWTIPEERTKIRKEHRVPLSAEARRITKYALGVDAKYVFPAKLGAGTKRSRPLTVNAFKPLYERLSVEHVSTHGFRSTFRDWCSEATDVSREVAEAALSHMPGQVERAYRRSDLFEKRVPLMNDWAAFVSSRIK